MSDRPDFIDIKETKEEILVFNHQSKNWKDANPQYDQSRIIIRGTEAGGGDRQRGQGSNMIVLDEPRDMVDLEYVIKNVVGWHLFQKQHPLMLIISTPPKIAEHYLVSNMIPEAREKHRYFEMPMSKDTDVTEEDVAFVLELCGSKESIAWQREAECSLVADPGDLVLYEWIRWENDCRVRGVPNDCIFKEYERPEYYYPVVTIDAGFGDANGVIFWFWDFKKQRMVILDEIFARGLNTEELKREIAAKELEVFHKARRLKDLRRDGDMTPQQRADLWAFFRFRVNGVDQHDKEAAIDATNASLAAGRILVSEKCKELLYQMRNASYRKGTRHFIRSARMGHCDLVSSLVTAHRSIKRFMKRDPFPPEGRYVGYQFYPELPEDQQSDLALISETEYHF